MIEIKNLLLAKCLINVHVSKYVRIIYRSTLKMQDMTKKYTITYLYV